jgi:hypothetical protein
VAFHPAIPLHPHYHNSSQSPPHSLPQGRGTYVFPKKFFKYEGSWVAGKRHGHGMLTMADGGYYEGRSSEDGNRPSPRTRRVCRWRDMWQGLPQVGFRSQLLRRLAKWRDARCVIGRDAVPRFASSLTRLLPTHPCLTSLSLLLRCLQAAVSW